VTVNKVCGSGMQTVMFASDMIRAGSAEVLLRGRHGVDEPRAYLVKEARWGIGINNVPFLDAMVNDGLWDAYNQYHMGITGEIVAEKFHVNREENGPASPSRASDAPLGHARRAVQGADPPCRRSRRGASGLMRGSARTLRWRSWRSFLRCSERAAK